MLRAAGLGSLAAGVGSAGRPRRARPTSRGRPALPQSRHGRGRSGRTPRSSIRPLYLRSFNFSHLARHRARALLPRVDARGRLAAARVRDLRRRPRDRDRSRPDLPGLDLQRPGAGTDAARHRGRSRPRPLHQPGHASAHAPLPRLAPAGDGRVAARAPGRARRRVPLRVRRRAVRPPPLPLPRHPAEAPHPQGSLRRVPGRSQAGASARRRDGDGDERVRHQLRRRERGVRSQHRRVPPHGGADPGQGRRAGAHQPGQRHRVRPHQQPAPARHVLRRLPHRHPPRDQRDRPTP